MLYAPNELAVRGAPGPGVAKLMTSLIEALAPRYRVGYLGPAAFGPPNGGKGEAQSRAAAALSSGAALAFTGDSKGFAYLGEETIDPAVAPALWQQIDILLVEGGDHPALPTIAAVDARGEILDEIASGRFGNLVALVLAHDLPEVVRARAQAIAAHPEIVAPRMPAPALLDLGDIPSMREVVVSFLQEQALKTPVYGVVLSGGVSSRMRRDKGSIDYHGTPQVRYAYRLLEGVCARTFVSIRSERAADPLFEGLEQIRDRFLEIGPMGGILSAMHAHPNAAWLVLGCDLPLVTKETLGELLAARDAMKLATCYESSTDGLPEPLCAIYEPGIRPRLLQFLAMGRDCPRKALINSRTHRIRLSDPHALDNVNDPEEMERVRTLIGVGQAGLP